MTENREDIRDLALRIAYELTEDGMTVLESALRRLAWAKDRESTRLFLETAFGKPKQPAELKTEKPLEIRVVFDDGEFGQKELDLIRNE